MEKLIEEYDLEVKKVHGKDEYKMYKNYINTVTETNIKKCLDEFLTAAEPKDNTKTGDILHTPTSQLLEKISDYHYLFTESLRYAVYNSKQYAEALACRAVANYRMLEYTNCLKDIKLALNADCPKHLQVGLSCYRASCFQILGNKNEMRSALDMHSKALEGVPESIAEKYKRKMGDLLIERKDDPIAITSDIDLLLLQLLKPKATGTDLPNMELVKVKASDIDLPNLELLNLKASDKDLPEAELSKSKASDIDLPNLELLNVKASDEDLPDMKLSKTKPSDTDVPDVELPTIEENPSFLNASNAVSFKFEEETGYRVIANRDITTGEVLFVEKAFAYAPSIDHTVYHTKQKEPKLLPIFCCYCIKITDNPIPCKNCVYNLYCDETCRDSAWDEFHHWECVGVSPKIFSFNNHGYLALRIIFKAVYTGLSISNLQLKDKSNKYGDKDNNYPYVCSLPTNLDKMSNQLLTLHCATAAFYVQFLNEKTDFFSKLKKLPGYRKKSKSKLQERIGGVIIRHCAQLHCYVTLMKTIHQQPGKNPENIDGPSKILTTAMTMCPSIALMKHSCTPNTAHYFVKDAAVVKATVDIKQNEEIFRTYTSVLFSNTSSKLDFSDADKRAGILKNYCFLNCKCETCKNSLKILRQMHAYLCIKCRGPAAKMASQTRLQCLNCTYKFSLLESTISKMEFVNYAIFKFRHGATTDMEKLEECLLEACESTYYPCNKIFAEIYDDFVNYYIISGNVKKYLFYSRKQINILKSTTVGKMEYASITYTICVKAINILRRKRPENDQELEEALGEIEAILSETEAILRFYYPNFICNINKIREKINDMRISDTAHGRYIL